MKKPPSKETVEAWALLMRSQQGLLAAVEQDLKAAGFPPLAWYDILLELKRAAPAPLTARELERETLLAQYNISRLLDRMEQAGLLLRRPSPEDRRVGLVSLTEKGRALLKRMWPAYGAAIERHLGSRLDRAEAASLSALLRKALGRR